MSISNSDTTPLLRDNSQSHIHVPLRVLNMETTTITTDSVAPAAPEQRLSSLDQYRGFIMLCLMVFSLLSRLNSSPSAFKEHLDYFGVADVTMPQFYLVVGFSMQLTLMRLRAKKGLRAMILKQLRRSRTLYLIGLLRYNIDDQTSWANLSDNWLQLLLQPILSRRLFQTLTIISIAQLIVLPVITRPIWARVYYMIGLMTIYMLGQWAFWMKHQWRNAIDGGSFGTFSWASLIIAGTFLNDWREWICVVPVSNVIARKHRVIKASIGLLTVAVVSWLLAYLISSIPASWSPICFSIKDNNPTMCPNMSLPSIPFVAPQTDVISIWTMSQRLVSLSFHLASIGYALPVYLFWYIVSDVYNFQFVFLKSLSTHSLPIYLLNNYAVKLATCTVPRDSPLYMLPVLFCIGFGGEVLILRFLEGNNIQLHL